MSSVTEQQVREALRSVSDPEIGRGLGDLGMLKSVSVTSTGVEIGIELPTPAYPRPERIAAAIRSAVTSKLPAAPEVKVAFTSTVKGKNTGGSIGLRVKNVIAVGSGKGGVGK